MTLVQALITTIVTMISAMYPVSVTAHHWALPFFLGWETPPPEFLGMLALAGFLAVFVHFIHDWAAILSSALKVVLLWKSPKTLDERLLFFILISALPVLGVWFYFQDFFLQIEITPLWVAGSLVFFCIPAWIGSRLNRNQKNMLNWTTLDAFWVGIMQVQVLLPGAGRQIGALAASSLRNFNLESAAKFSFLSFAPLLAVYAFGQLKGFSFSNPMPAPDTTWLTFGVSFVVAFFCGLLAISGFMKNIERKKMGFFYGYRILLAVSILVMSWIRSRTEGA